MPPRRSTRWASPTRRASSRRIARPSGSTTMPNGAQRAGCEVIIAGAGGAAHLPGMTAALTPLPVLGVPVESQALKGMDSLLSIVQMPAGVPVATLGDRRGRRGQCGAASPPRSWPRPTPAAGAALDAWRAGADRSGAPSARTAMMPAAMLAPGATIGILGGGQLGRMTALAAARLGYRCHVFATEADSPAAQVCGAATVAEFDRRRGARRASPTPSTSSTFEFENIPAEAVRWSRALKPVLPRARDPRYRAGPAARKGFPALDQTSTPPPIARSPMPAAWLRAMRDFGIRPCSRRCAWAMTARAR